MEATRIHEEITHLLYKVEEQYSRIIRFNENIPIIEVDLAIKDVQDLYESFLDLRVAAELQRRKAQQGIRKETPATEKPQPITQNSPPAPAKEVAPEPQKPTPEIQLNGSDPVESKNIKDIAVVSEQPKKAPEPGEKSEEPVKAEVLLEPVVIKKDEPAIKAEEPAKAVTPPANTPPPVIAPKVDLLKEREKDFVPTVRKIEFRPEPINAEPKKENLFEKAASLYDKIAKPTDKTLATAATRQPISNIKSSIGINEKFTFLKDLFRNNVNDYNEALDKLNNFDSYGDAEDYFQDLKSKYNWDPEGKSFQGLADLLNRRYLHNA